MYKQYADAVGHAPPLPGYAALFWQCRLRYRTQASPQTIPRMSKMSTHTPVVRAHAWPMHVALSRVRGDRASMPGDRTRVAGYTACVCSVYPARAHVCRVWYVQAILEDIARGYGHAPRGGD